MNNTYKTCNKCGVSKRRIEFYKNSRTKDRLHGWCKDCCIEAAKQWQKDNKDRINFNKLRRRTAARTAEHTMREEW